MQILKIKILKYITKSTFYENFHLRQSDIYLKFQKSSLKLLCFSFLNNSKLSKTFQMQFMALASMIIKAICNHTSFFSSFLINELHFTLYIMKGFSLSHVNLRCSLKTPTLIAFLKNLSEDRCQRMLNSIVFEWKYLVILCICKEKWIRK